MGSFVDGVCGALLLPSLSPVLLKRAIAAATLALSVIALVRS